MTSREITRNELQTRIMNKVPLVLLEALPEPYYSRGHLPGALNLPHDQVRALAGALVPEKTAELVVYCANRTCRNSHVAAATLKDMGYPNVSVFAGGKQEWEEARLPLEG